MQKNKLTVVLWSVFGVLAFGLLFARAVYPELLWLTLLTGVPLLGVGAYLIRENQMAFKTRSAAFGLNSAITVLLVFFILGVLNFLTVRYSTKWDLTKNKIHTLSDQTAKMMQGLPKPVKATYFAKIQQREQTRPLLENYRALNPGKFEIEYVDPDKEPTRVRQAGVKKYGTLQLAVGPRENKIEDVNEEKLTNALMKLLKEKSPQICAVTGNGEKSFTSAEADGFDHLRKALSDQSYEVKEVNLLQEGKVPATCDQLMLMGPSRAMPAAEVQMIQDYLANGGRAIVALDINLKGGEANPELIKMLESWYIKTLPSLIVDPVSKLLGADASVALLATYQKEHPITKEFQANCLFPFSRPFEVIPGAPSELKVQWLAQSTPKSWGVADLAQLAKGQVAINESKDKKGPLNAAMVVEGKLKDSKASRNTRLVVFGSSLFANNNFSRLGNNLDFIVNSSSWLLEDDSMISIRAKEEGPGRVDLSQKAGTLIFLVTVIVIPLLVAIGGIVIWVIRRRL